jgi:hypothetical protein
MIPVVTLIDESTGTEAGLGVTAGDADGRAVGDGDGRELGDGDGDGFADGCTVGIGVNDADGRGGKDTLPEHAAKIDATHSVETKSTD